MRTTDDAIRSLKKHLAVVLGAAPPPLCAARLLRPPSDVILAEAAETRAHGVWTGLDETDTPVEAVLATRDDADGYVRVPILAGDRRRWYITPPGFRRYANGTLAVFSAVEDTYSPGLVAGCWAVTQGPEQDEQWEAFLGQPRFGFDLEFTEPTFGRAYRVRPFLGLPLVSLSGDVIEDDAVPAPDDWDVRFFHDRGALTLDSYPVAVVKAAGPAIPASPSTNWSEVVMPLVLYLYPSAPAGSDLELGAAQLAAERVRQLVLASFTALADKPMRLPLFDYDGVGYQQGSSQREVYDYLRVVDCSVTVTPEPEEENQVAVVCDLRVAWTVADEKRGSHVADGVVLDVAVR